MSVSDDEIFDALATHVALSTTADVWFEAARGATTVEAAARVASDNEAPELVARSMQLFAPGDPAVDEARLEHLLSQCFPPVRRRARWPAMVGLPLALAAALVLAVRLSGSIPPSPDATTPDLPYALELGPSVSSQRAVAPQVDGSPTTWFLDRRFRAVLRPWSAVHHRVQAAVYACEAGSARRLPVVPQINPKGIVVIEDDVRALGLAPGTWELLFVVAPATSPPSLRTCHAADLESSVDAGQVLRASVTIAAPP